MLNHCFASVADVTFPELPRSIAVTTPTALARIGALTRARAVPTPDIPQLHVLHEGREERDRIPWAPVVMSAIVLGTSLFAASPLTDAATGAATPGARLALSFSYLILAPICDVLDTLSMFSQRQHLAFLATCALLYAAWRVSCRNLGSARQAGFGKESLMAILALLSLVTLYAVGTTLPRPIARLEPFWSSLRSLLRPHGRVFFVDSLLEQESTAKDHGQLDRSGIVRRRLNDGREFDIVKVFHDPTALTDRLQSLGWRAEVHASGRFFLYGSAT